MEIRNKHIYLLTDLLPQYRFVNSLYRQLAEDWILSFEAQCRITDFYNEFKNIQAFEKAILNLQLSTDKEKLAPIISNLRTEINKNVDVYTFHKDLFDRINLLEVCTGRYNPLHIEIEGQLTKTNKLWQEIIQVRSSLEPASWRNDQIAVERLTKEKEQIEGLYKKEQQKLNALYQKQKESDNHAIRYMKNVFGQIFELGSSFISLLDTYFPIERKKEQQEIKPTLKTGVCFDMQLVSKIHNECNNIQFNNLSELDLYALLNLQPNNAKFIVKPREGTRVCFLISKLYDYLKTDNKKEWRTAILKSADIKEDYYQSKYKEPVSEFPSRKSEEFAERINKIFKELS